MKKVSLILSAVVMTAMMLSSCGGGASTDVVDTIVDVEERFFEYFEDYMAIDNRAELDSLFGDQLEHKTVWYNEGTEERQLSKLTNTESGYTVAYVWKESNPEELGDIEVYYNQYNENFEETGKQVLASNTGVKLGMSFAEFRTWNEAAFDFSGFGWDFGGGVLRSDGKYKDCRFTVYFSMDYEADTEAYSDFIGDMVFSSDDEGLDNPPFYIESFRYTVGD